MENQPREDENAAEVCDVGGLWTHFGPAASAPWKLPLGRSVTQAIPHTSSLVGVVARPCVVELHGLVQGRAQ
eukprot:38819-Chlamydomonas_euryale.AAC.1